MSKEASNDYRINLSFLFQCVREILKQTLIQTLWFIFGIAVSFFPLFVINLIALLRSPDIDFTSYQFWGEILHKSIDTNDFRYICISALFILHVEKSLLYKYNDVYKKPKLLQLLDIIVFVWFSLGLLAWFAPVVDNSIYDNISTILLSVISISTTLILGILTLISHCAAKYFSSLGET